MSLFSDQYRDVAIPKLKERFGYTNVHEVPRVTKVTVNIGTGKGLKDAKLMEAMMATLRRITGQEPVQRKARKSIANFNIREDQIVGLSVTLRGNRMRNFLEKLVRVTLPRVRDFRGIPSEAFDGHGNYAFGMTENTVFPEIRADEVEYSHGLQICVTTTAKNDEEARLLLQSMGFPFAKQEEGESRSERKKARKAARKQQKAAEKAVVAAATPSQA